MALTMAASRMYSSPVNIMSMVPEDLVKKGVGPPNVIIFVKIKNTTKNIKKI